MTSQYFLNRIAGQDPNLRAGDADRERVAGRLRKAHAEGRSDPGVARLHRSALMEESVLRRHPPEYGSIPLWVTDR